MGVGGCYRIPQKGQLQIVIKNPNKTAVKLFLVQYDLRDMEPGTKTFIRQKSYSAPGAGLAGDEVAAKGVSVSDHKEKDSLRYLIHLHIVCPSRGRYYLFKNIRVVFANRVPDGKEKLRNETTWPEPKFSTWRPVVDGPVPDRKRERAASLHHLHHQHQHLVGGVLGRRETHPPPMPIGVGMGIGREENEAGKLEWTKREPESWAPPEHQQGLLARRLKKLEVEEEKGSGCRG